MYPLPSRCSTVHDIIKMSIKLGYYYYHNYRFDKSAIKKCIKQFLGYKYFENKFFGNKIF